MSNIVIKAENISKQYRLGEVGTGSIAHDLNVFWHRLRGKENPYLKIGEANDRTTKGSSEYVWALQDINFEVNRGEVLGIIGRNGAGKSTLLKILSKTTAPTTGSIKIKGRIASLLEVGTGFHPDLSGRENIFLNGAILGMTKKEIKSKFDEIVDFAGIERYIDTPVKRYSSGMYVRLAFAVAAHLEPDILIVDEVLAVGDAEFQKKCLGKMKDVSNNDGRTILFVSHNMGAIAQLCTAGIVLKDGILVANGEIRSTIDKYVLNVTLASNSYKAKNDCDKAIFIKSVKTLNTDFESTTDFQFDSNIVLDISINIKNYNPLTKISVTLQNNFGDYLSTFVESLSNFYREGENNVSFKIKMPSNLIAPNTYAFRIALFIPNQTVYDLVEMICPVKIHDSGTGMAIFEGINYGNFFMDYRIIK